MAEQSLSTPLGALRIRSDGSMLTEISFSASVLDQPDSLTELACRQISEYFAGSRQAFSLPLLIRGTPFAQSVYRALLEIPYGQTTTYGLLAARAGYPGAARAVGSAMRKNPLVLVVPCHRVLAANGLGGYSCGLEKKRWLLLLEQADFSG